MPDLPPNCAGWEKKQAEEEGWRGLNFYLSHGMGVNSTALMLHLINKNVDFESVFIDHGGDYPETYQYLQYLQDKGYKITVIKPDVVWKGHHSNIYDYFFFHKSIPLIQFRICTQKFKIEPFNKFIKKPATVYVGYDYAEGKRVLKQRKRTTDKIIYSHPLFDDKITRVGCVKIIQDHGLLSPKRSQCFFCPFQSKGEWKRLMVEKPELFKKALALEANAGKPGLYLADRWLRSIYQDNTLDNYVVDDEWECGIGCLLRKRGGVV